MKNEILLDCECVIALLESVAPYEWAEAYIRHRTLFWRKYCLNLIFSTLHGANFFENVRNCLNGKSWEPDNKGEYEQNFRKFINHYKA